MKKIIKTFGIIMTVALVVALLAACNQPAETTIPTEPTTPPCEHMWTAATCETAKTCVLCGETEGEPKGHEIVVDEAKAVTCTEDGLTAGEHCARCDYAIAQETITAPGHTEVVDEAVDPTCVATGLTAGKHCSACNEVLVAQSEVAMVAHKIAYVTTLPTAEAAGSTVGTCSACEGTFTYDEVNVMGAGTYTLEASALSGIAQYSLADGEVKVVGGVFECHLSNKYKTDTSKKTFSDGYNNPDRMNFGGKTEINSEANPDMIKNGIVFTITEAATVTIWWVEGGDDHRQVALYDMDGNVVVQSDDQESAKNDPCMSTFTVPAGTYIIGNAINTNYMFKVEVVVGTPEVPAE
jgi:hypothetical protein